jgi:glycosyltransferase involved in cell wall biosynthesis
MQKPIISIFLPTLLIGGAEKSLVELANGLAGLGWRIQLLVMAKEGPLIDELNENVDLIDLKCLSYRHAVFVLARYYKKHRPMVILTSVYATGLAAVAAKILSGYKPKVVIGAHNSLRAKFERPDNIKDKYFLKPLCKLLFPWADGFIAVSKNLALELETLIRLPKHRIRTIYNPVVFRKLAARASEQVAHPWLAVSTQRDFKTLISVGRLVEQKGFDVLLDALFIVRKYCDCRLIIVGGGPLRTDLEAIVSRLRLEENVDFVGWQENPYKFVSRSDLFVLSSRWEGLGNVLIEALACGCPVVATDCQYGPKEILEGGRYGDLVEVNNASDLASKILSTLQTSFPPAESDVRKSRSLDFTVEAAVEQYSQYFSKIWLATDRNLAQNCS